MTNLWQRHLPRLTGAALWIAITALPLAGQAPIVLNDSSHVYELGKYLAYYEDATLALTIDEVSSPDYAAKFNNSEEATLSLGFSRSVYWLRFTLETNQSQLSTLGHTYLLELAYPHYNRVDLYLPDADDGWTVMRAGRLQTGQNRPDGSRSILFSLPQYQALPATMYMRLESEASFILPLKIWTQTGYTNQLANKRLGLGIYYGILLGLLFYNLFLFFSIRELTYIYYCVYVLCYGLYQMAYDGLARIYILGEYLQWEVYLALISIHLSYVFGFLFARSYLELAHRNKSLDRLFLMFALLAFVAAMTGPVWQMRFLNYSSHILGWSFFIVVLTTAGFAQKKAYLPARWLFIAFGAMTAGLIGRSLRGAGILPDIFMVTYSLHIGSALEMILLSLGLADRFKTLRAERDSAYVDARDRVARNLHDEVGSTLSGIILFTDAMDTVEDERERQRFLGKIKQSAVDAQEKMRDLLWVINPGNDSWEVLLSKMRRYASDLFDSLEIQYDIDFPNHVSLKNLDMEQRQHFWLIYKEIVNNIAKHANTDYAHIGLSIRGHTVKLRVQDRGTGFDRQTMADSNGIENIHQRAAKLGGTAKLDSAPGEGTKWFLKFSV